MSKETKSHYRELVEKLNKEFDTENYDRGARADNNAFALRDVLYELLYLLDELTSE